MRQIARVGARFFRLPFRMGEQRVQLLHHRLHFQRQRIGDAVGASGANPRNRAADTAQRAEAVPCLQHRHQEQPDAQHRERPAENRAGAPHLRIGRGARTGDHILPLHVATRQLHAALDHAQTITFQLVRIGKSWVDWFARCQCQPFIPQRTRGVGRHPRCADLPIEPAIGFQKPLITQRPVVKYLAQRIDLGRGNHRGEREFQLRIELAQHEVGQHPVQRDPAQQQQRHDPQRGDHHHPLGQAARVRGCDGHSFAGSRDCTRFAGRRVASGHGVTRGRRRGDRRGCNRGHGWW